MNEAGSPDTKAGVFLEVGAVRLEWPDKVSGSQNGSEVCPVSKKFNIQKKIYNPAVYLGIRCLGRLLDLLGI
jgi:hypothetical protein